MSFDAMKIKKGWPDSVRTRFEKKYQRSEKTGCWLWTGASGGRGYGAFSLGGRSHTASRVSWMLYRGEIPEGLIVCHKCDVPLCVNPDHLFLGTDKDNTDDCRSKNRMPMGEKCVSSKIKETDVIEIRSSSIPQRQLAKKFGICVAHVNRIKKGRRWACVK